MVNLIIIKIGSLIDKIVKISNRFRNKYIVSKFKNRGENCHIEGFGNFTCQNIEVGSNVYIGDGCSFLSSDANIIIGNNVMFGLKVNIVTGNHRIDVIGEYMLNIKEKRDEDDEDVIIEDDVWIGMGATVLKGVRIGKGSVIGAGSIVTKDIPPYSIHVGISPKRIDKRFTEAEINKHEIILKRKRAMQNG